MTSRDRVIRTLQHLPVDRAPRDLWLAPVVEATRADEVHEIHVRYPADILRIDPQAAKGVRPKSAPGEQTDAWGCVWQSAERWAVPQLKHSPLADLRKLEHFRLPWDVLQKLTPAAINRGCAGSQFNLGSSDVRPLDRLQQLVGPEAAIAELRHGGQAVRELLHMLHDYFCRELEHWAASDVDGVAFRDDWGADAGLLLPEAVWRDLFRPLYHEYCDILRSKDKYVFFRSSGSMAAILDDLIRAGIDAVHLPLRCDCLRTLAERHRGRVTFWAGLDGPAGVPEGTKDEVRASVRRVRDALDTGRGGLIAQCHWAAHVSFDQIAAALESWLAPAPCNNAVRLG